MYVPGFPLRLAARMEGLASGARAAFSEAKGNVVPLWFHVAANEVDSVKDWARFPGSRGRTQAGIILANVALFDALQAAHKGATPVPAYARGNAILVANIGEHTGVVRGYENYAFAMTLGEHGLLATAGVLNPETHELTTPAGGIQRGEIIALPNSQSAIPIFK